MVGVEEGGDRFGKKDFRKRVVVTAARGRNSEVVDHWASEIMQWQSPVKEEETKQGKFPALVAVVEPLT